MPDRPPNERHSAFRDASPADLRGIVRQGAIELQKSLDRGGIAWYTCLRRGILYAPLRKRYAEAMMPAPTVESWVDSLQARGRYTFLRAEAISGSGLSAEAVKKALQRLARRRRVAKVKSYFYVIVPLEYLHAGGPPPSWFIDDLMRAMERAYYVGLLSAAALHGASHQQPQEFQVFTDRPIRPMQVGPREDSVLREQAHGGYHGAEREDADGRDARVHPGVDGCGLGALRESGRPSR